MRRLLVISILCLIGIVIGVITKNVGLILFFVSILCSTVGAAIAQALNDLA